MAHKEKGSQEELITGAALTLLFSFLYFKVGGWFWIFPLVFAGLLPLLRGLSARFSRSNTSSHKTLKKSAKDEKARKEKEILRLAKKNDGKLTVTAASLESELTLEETEKVLSELSDRGYARMEVEDDGSISYLFPDFRRIEE